MAVIYLDQFSEWSGNQTTADLEHTQPELAESNNDARMAIGQYAL